MQEQKNGYNYIEHMVELDNGQKAENNRSREQLVSIFIEGFNRMAQGMNRHKQAVSYRIIIKNFFAYKTD